MENTQCATLGGFRFRAAAFWRLLNCVDSFIKRSSECKFQFIDNLENEEDKIIESVLNDMKRGGARSDFYTNNPDVINKIVLKVLKAFQKNPKIYGKIVSCMAIQYIGSSMLLISEKSVIQDRNRRASEMTTLAGMFNRLAEDSFGVEHIPFSSLSKEGTNEYLIFSLSTV
jgi:hypothetical protein